MGEDFTVRQFADNVGKKQVEDSSTAAVNEVFEQWSNLSTTQVSDFKQALSPYLPQLSVAFLGRDAGNGQTYFQVIDANQDGVLESDELRDFERSTESGAARIFAEYLILHFGDFDGADGSVDGKIDNDTLMRSAGFHNSTDGSVTRLTEDGRFEITYPSGIQLLVRETSNAQNGGAAQPATEYRVPGPPAVTLVNQGGNSWNMTVDGVQTAFEGTVEMTLDGVVLTRPDNSTVTFDPDGKIYYRDSSNRLTQINSGNTALTRYAYDNSGNMDQYWANGQHWWVDYRLGNWGTWESDQADYSARSVVVNQNTGDVSFDYNGDRPSSTWHVNGSITTTMDTGVSITRDWSGKIVACVIPPESRAWHRFEDGNNNPDDDRWGLDTGMPTLDRPNIQFMQDANGNVSEFTMTYNLDSQGERTRVITRDGSGHLLEVTTNPGGETFVRVGDQYEYRPSPGVSYPATLSEESGVPVFTVAEGSSERVVTFRSNGEMLMTLTRGDSVTTYSDSGQISSEQHRNGRTILREDGEITVIDEVTGSTTKYQMQVDGFWRVITGITDLATGAFIATPGEPAIARGGLDAQGNFILFYDEDQNMQTFDPGANFLRITAEADVATVQFSDYTGEMSFTDHNGIKSTIEVTSGAITALEQTAATPDGRHLSVQFSEGRITLVNLPDGSALEPVLQQDGSIRWRHNVDGQPAEYLAVGVTPQVNPNGELTLGYGNVWQSDSDGQLVWTMATEGGFEEHYSDGHYVVHGNRHRITYDSDGQMVQQVFGNSNNPESLARCVVISYTDGQVSEVTTPRGRCYKDDGGQWFYDDGSPPPIELTQAPQIDSDNKNVAIIVRNPGDGEPVGYTIGEHPFFERIMPEEVVQSGSGTEETGSITERFDTGVLLGLTDGSPTSVALPDGSYYELVQAGPPKSWRYRNGDMSEVVQGEIEVSDRGRTITRVNGTEIEIYYLTENGVVERRQSTQNGLTTTTYFQDGRISSVDLPDGSRLESNRPGDATAWHWVHNGIDTRLSQHLTLSLDQQGRLIFNNDTADDVTTPLIGNDGRMNVPVPEVVARFHDIELNGVQVPQLVLPDGQGIWTRVSMAGQPEVWRFTGPDGEPVERSGQLTVDAEGRVTFTAADGSSAVYTYSRQDGRLQTVVLTDTSGITTVNYVDGRIASISIPAGNSMQAGDNDHWTISVPGSGNSLDILGTPAVVAGRLVMQYGDTTTAIVDTQTGNSQFRTNDGVLNLDSDGNMVLTDQTQMIAILSADSSWLQNIAAQDGSISRAALQSAIDGTSLTPEQRAVALYMVQNFERMHPLYDSESQTLLVVSETGVEFYGNGGSADRTVTSQELILMLNPNLPDSLWAEMVQNGTLTKERLNDMITNGDLSPEQRAAALYLQANWNRIARSTNEDILDIPDAMPASDILAYGRANGINFPAAPVDIPADSAADTSDEAVVVGQPVEVFTIGDNAVAQTVVSDSTYVAVEWLNQHQLFMRQFMLVDPATGLRTGEIDRQKVIDRINALSAKTSLTADEQMQLDSLNALQGYLNTTADSPPTAERFFRSVLLANETPENGPIGARTLGPTDTVYSMARQYLIETWCRDQGMSVEATQNILDAAQRGGRLDPELTRHITENLQGQIDFIFEANHIVGSNIAVGQLLILDPALAPLHNDAIHLAPASIDSNVFTEVPNDNQSEHVTHVRNRNTGEEAYLFDSGISLTRGSAGNWCVFDEHGNLLGTVSDDAIDREAIATGNFTLGLESEGEHPIASIVVSDLKTTVVFQQGGHEDIYPNGVHVHFNQMNVVDKVILPNGITALQMVGPNNQVTGYQISYPGGRTEVVEQPLMPAANGAITVTGTDGRLITIAADGTITQTPAAYVPGGGGFQDSLALAS